MRITAEWIMSQPNFGGADALARGWFLNRFFVPRFPEGATVKDLAIALKESGRPQSESMDRALLSMCHHLAAQLPVPTFLEFVVARIQETAPLWPSEHEQALMEGLEAVSELMKAEEAALAPARDTLLEVKTLSEAVPRPFRHGCEAVLYTLAAAIAYRLGHDPLCISGGAAYALECAVRSECGLSWAQILDALAPEVDVPNVPPQAVSCPVN